MLATLVAQSFSRKGWLFESKLDGIRCLAVRSGNRLVLYTRNRRSLNARFPEIVAALLQQASRDFAVDGEIVVFRDGGVSSFAALQQLGQVKRPVFFCVFDLLRLAGEDIRPQPLLRRKQRLRTALSFTGPLRYHSHRLADGERMYEEACRKGLEGLIAKDSEAPYVGGRSRAWLKIKCTGEQEFVIGGWTNPQGSREGFGALLLGYHEAGRLRFAGKVGTGFGRDLLRELPAKLERLARDTPPFGEKVPGATRAHWVEPRLVAQVGFAQWTDAGRLRAPRFHGLRDDRKASEVTREKARA
jgi:DNA ligase D-like protein (predicted ligase)